MIKVNSLDVRLALMVIFQGEPPSTELCLRNIPPQPFGTLIMQKISQLHLGRGKCCRLLQGKATAYVAKRRYEA